ncbi:MAG TPA: CaiB/BaiF CoA-transferase family protein [Thermoanaerobaculia bacterium]|nr:CaiB/BaiF CoA-transferase family protein [Thermoanaerobaculia bacterium]
MGPLDGIRVLDLSRLAPGPFCSMLLADLGADVVRIDAPGTPVGRYDMLSRNKRSIVLDLKNAEGQRVLHRLCAGADVLLEGNRPGVMARLNGDFETISAINPRLVYCSLTGFGQEGPLAPTAGHDINYIAIAGVLGQIGLGEGTRPVPPLNLVADFGGGGLLAALGIVAALLERTRSGQGQYLDAAMIDGSAALMAAHYSTRGLLSAPGRGLLGGGAPFYRCYRTGDGGYMAVGSIEPKFFAALCAGTGLDFVAEQMDRERWPAQMAAFEERFAEKTRAEWTEIFTRLDACVTPVLGLDEAAAHPHNVARAGFPIGPDGERHVAPAPRFSRTPGSIRSGGPGPGSDTDAVLAEAGLGDQVAALRAAGAFGAP